MPLYSPIVTGVRMSDYGYWVVDVSVAPGRTVSVMIAVVGITPGAAAQYALSGTLPHPPGGTT
jgi:hypothetical protein